MGGVPVRWHLTGITGKCVHPGFAEGRVCRPGEPADGSAVLVASSLSPAQVPDLFDCAAMVLEAGGITSHAAITARELGIPALVDAAGATRQLEPGDHLFVDTERCRVLKAVPDEGCPFCTAELPELDGGPLLRVVEDMFPVVRSHLLLVPRDHLTDPSELLSAHWSELGGLVARLRGRLTAETGSADLNLAMNVGAAAGQTIEHLHWHILPRRPGDDEDPRGGLRRLVGRPWRPYPAPR
nr:PEP-utilizing enzyme [Streptomyces albus]